MATFSSSLPPLSECNIRDHIEIYKPLERQYKFPDISSVLEKTLSFSECNITDHIEVYKPRRTDYSLNFIVSVIYSPHNSPATMQHSMLEEESTLRLEHTLTKVSSIESYETPIFSFSDFDVPPIRSFLPPLRLLPLIPRNSNLIYSNESWEKVMLFWMGRNDKSAKHSTDNNFLPELVVMITRFAIITHGLRAHSNELKQFI